MPAPRLPAELYQRILEFVILDAPTAICPLLLSSRVFYNAFSSRKLFYTRKLVNSYLGMLKPYARLLYPEVPSRLTSWKSPSGYGRRSEVLIELAPRREDDDEESDFGDDVDRDGKGGSQKEADEEKLLCEYRRLLRFHTIAWNAVKFVCSMAEPPIEPVEMDLFILYSRRVARFTSRCSYYNYKYIETGLRFTGARLNENGDLTKSRKGFGSWLTKFEKGEVNNINWKEGGAPALKKWYETAIGRKEHTGYDRELHGDDYVAWLNSERSY